MTLDELGNAFKRASEEIEDKLFDITVQVAFSSIQLIRDRLNDGVDASGSKLKPYSEKPFWLVPNHIPESAKRKLKSQVKKNGFYKGYKAVREASGRQTSVRDYFFSGAMLNNVDVVAQALIDEGVVSVDVDAKDKKQRDILGYNQDRDNTKILENSEEEVMLLLEDFEEEIIEIVNRNIDG